METAEKRDIIKENMIITLVLWIILSVGCMSLMLYTAAHKTIVIPNDGKSQLELTLTEVQDNSYGQDNKLIFEQEGSRGSFCIPLEKEVKAENVVVENRYMDKELWVYIQDAADDFYRENAVRGDIAPIIEGNCDPQADGIVLKLKMDRVLEYQTTMENGTMVITFRRPSDVYSRIVVIDPAGGGDETGIEIDGYTEKDLALQVAELIPEKVQQSDCKLYLTRTEDVKVSLEERIDLVEAVDADLYIRISANEDADTAYYGIQSYYNETYFIPDFGNVQLADLLTRKVTIAANNQAVGLVPAAEDSILQKITVPGAQIAVGYLTNPQERALLEQEVYREKLAQGIADAIVEAYNSMNSNSKVPGNET